MQPNFGLFVNFGMFVTFFCLLWNDEKNGFPYIRYLYVIHKQLINCKVTNTFKYSTFKTYVKKMKSCELRCSLCKNNFLGYENKMYSPGLTHSLILMDKWTEVIIVILNNNSNSCELNLGIMAEKNTTWHSSLSYVELCTWNLIFHRIFSILRSSASIQRNYCWFNSW